MVDRIEDAVREAETEVREMIDIADQRFDNKRDQLYRDTDREIEQLEERLMAKIQEALDNPLAN
jgi:vacuolar-type H+-ATPase subunit H